MEINIEIPDHIVAHIRKKYSTISDAYKKQCPCQLRNIASLELVEGLQYSTTRSTDQRGNTGKSIQLSYSSLFKDEHDRKDGSKRILITGEADIGKTILCASIAEDWQMGSSFRNFGWFFSFHSARGV